MLNDKLRPVINDNGVSLITVYYEVDSTNTIKEQKLLNHSLELYIENKIISTVSINVIMLCKINE